MFGADYYLFAGAPRLVFRPARGFLIEILEGYTLPVKKNGADNFTAGDDCLIMVMMLY